MPIKSSKSSKAAKASKKSKTSKASKAAKTSKPVKAAKPEDKVIKTKLNKKDLEYFRNLLLDVKQGLINDVKSMVGGPNSGDAESRDLSGHVQHMADVATDMYDKEFNTNLASKDREVIAKIDDALKRIDNGTYGICLGTGKPIPKARLKAIPYAEYCLEYQEELENKPAPQL